MCLAARPALCERGLAEKGGLPRLVEQVVGLGHPEPFVQAVEQDGVATVAGVEFAPPGQAEDAVALVGTETAAQAQACLLYTSRCV